MDLSMKIANLSSDLYAGKVQQQIGTAMLSKTMEVQQTQGEGVVKMMELSVNPNLGSNFDMSV